MNRGETFGKYEILEEIGVGGFATVYKAKDTMLDREVALKVLRRELSSDPAFVQSFEAEAWRAAELEHPNIVRIYEVGRFEDTPYLAMEYVDGQSLAEVIQGFGRLTVPQALKIVRGVAAGLDAAHSRGLVHRGVKPSNILIGRDGRVCLRALPRRWRVRSE
jgi:serine/threonine protein kinase